MTGQDIVTLAETLTGRTSESTRMLARVNAIYRRVYSEHEFQFALNQQIITLTPRVKNLSVGFTDGGSLVTGGGATLASNVEAPGGWLDVPSKKQRYYITNGTVFVVIRPPATFTDTVTTHWFKTAFSLSRGGVALDFDGRDFGRIKSVWQDDTQQYLTPVSESDYNRRFGTVDIDTVGPPQVYAQTMVDRHNGSTMVKEPGILVWPIPDKEYFLNIKFFRVPTDLTLADTPLLGDARFHDILAYGAAYLTRLDDVDSTWQAFLSEYQRKLEQLVWAYGIAQNAPEDALGPRQGGSGAAQAGFNPW